MPYAPRPDFYREKLSEETAFWADLYALTMAQALFTNGRHNTTAIFQAFIRKPPFGSPFLVTGGQDIVAEWLDRHWRFDDADLRIMTDWEVTDSDGVPVRLFTPAFIEECRTAKMDLTVDMMQEGEIAFADEPIAVVRGKVWKGLMVEAAILNCINSQSLFGTLAARLKLATRSNDVAAFTQKDDNPLFEMGLRRAQCIGGKESSRGAYGGGVDATSNLLARKYYGVPAIGTFSHALVMVYEDELAAFCDYARALPHNGIFLVDTYNTLDGVKKAIEACRQTGAALKGVRLDSGDLAYLSFETRKLLDQAGFTQAKIAATNDLDEHEILKLRRAGARIDIWGVGTRLVTAKADPALGAVYKLASVDETDGAVRNVIKLGEKPRPGEPEKATIPGAHIVLRTMQANAVGEWRWSGDIIALGPAARYLAPDSARPGVHDGILAHDIVSVPRDSPMHAKTFRAGTPVMLPLCRMFEDGTLTGTIGNLDATRRRVHEKLAMLDPDQRRLESPYLYGVGLEESLHRLRETMILQRRAKE